METVTDVSSIDPIILAVVTAAEAAVTYPVFDGPPTPLPARTVTQFVCIGADALEIEELSPPVNSARMSQEWKGLGQAARYEKVGINCVAVGRADTVANARSAAMAVVTDIGRSLPVHPTSKSYNALVSDILSVRSKPASGGAFVHVLFVISANARLT